MSTTTARFFLSISLLSAFAFGCTTTSSNPTPGAKPKPAAAKQPAEPVIRYYIGTVTTTSPDGVTPFGPPKQTAVMRTVNESAGAITEVVLDEGQLRPTMLTQSSERPQVFTATDHAATFSGTLTCVGRPFACTGWRYALAMSDGSGRIEGSSIVDDNGIVTEKFFVDATGVRRAKVVDRLKLVPKATYDSMVAKMAR